ncbi:MAG: 1-(5-phosphoribosyl)-5-[(5-phosphoribosylamino)methylideneamino]imidazole-4-carboxamide isomerase, partial [Planctomycetia bacterium]
MLLFPAIDLRAGRCVRLKQGDYAQETVYSDDPVAVARRWADLGADWIHLVDLDGAREGRPINTDVIRKIVAAVRVPCQLGGGLRTDDSVDAALSLGVARAIVGTQAVKEPEWFLRLCEIHPRRVVLGLDARNGQVATQGWLDTSSVRAVDLLQKYEAAALGAVVYTDISRDGMLGGPNVEATAALAASTKHFVIASGGVSKLADVLEVQR